jgi:hypothetical protein
MISSVASQESLTQSSNYNSFQETNKSRSSSLTDSLERQIKNKSYCMQIESVRKLPMVPKINYNKIIENNNEHILIKKPERIKSYNNNNSK